MTIIKLYPRYVKALPFEKLKPLNPLLSYLSQKHQLNENSHLNSGNNSAYHNSGKCAEIHD
jgi:hypothetical protein